MMARFRRRGNRKTRFGRRKFKYGSRNALFSTWMTRHRRNVYTRSMIGGPRAPHMFKRWTNAPGGVSALFNTNLFADNFFIFKFRLSDLPNYTEFTTLYDQYMITKVVLKFYHIRDQALITNTAPAGGTSGGYILSVIDHDDDNTPANADELRQYANCKIVNIGYDWSRVTVPAVLRQMYETSVATAYTPSFHQWISTTDPNTEHFGIKVCLHANDANAVTNSIQYSVDAMYYIKCKNVK